MYSGPKFTSYSCSKEPPHPAAGQTRRSIPQSFWSLEGTVPLGWFLPGIWGQFHFPASPDSRGHLLSLALVIIVASAPLLTPL